MLSTSRKKYEKKMIAKGKQKGKLEGIKETKIDTVRKMNKLNFSIDDICAVGVI